MRLLRLAASLIFVICLGTMAMAQQGATAAKSGKMTVTGCVQKGQETGGYYLNDESGKIWELSGAKVADHVGHKVTLTGMSTSESKAEEAKKETSEKAEAGGKAQGDFQVTSVKMLSDSCQ